ncbi:hypothetical protein BCR33DRAFT_461603 [Rhizoclosmatium globosum]|uniref:Uncharacterized protein n=1 Tax=Rhizoclosmatium globosum TaxID=329046 RepID=A0A1Y2CXW3_9FUNG|nr:hypothetical protein BCR33DRAFT_461603 [Rhizoclosmatium globosum]|eukprot:ORY51674.1 hypothetical protein BCR33DRAFT_461603 [Rhizoclosmatium globosum]
MHTSIQDAPKPIIPATTISKEAVPEPPSSDHTSAVLLAEEKLKRLCMSINGLPRTPSEHKPKVYDYIVYQGYLDHLEIRLNTLAAHVHTFIIVYHKTHQLSKLEHNLALLHSGNNSFLFQSLKVPYSMLE